MAFRIGPPERARPVADLRGARTLFPLVADAEPKWHAASTDDEAPALARHPPLGRIERRGVPARAREGAQMRRLLLALASVAMVATAIATPAAAITND